MTSPVDQYREGLRQAIEALRAVREERDALLAAASEPIAVVGLACRFPGGADGPDTYWKALAEGVDAVREIPADRWPQEALPGDRPAVRWAGLLDRVDGFDAAFFGISPREAESLDPQQRLLLEVAWEALEDAGQRPDRLGGSATGVFVGMYALDYQHRVMERGREHFDVYCATGNLLSTAAGRISYVLGLTGPSMSVDTACSSSLVAITQACQSLRAGDCDLALAGGVNLVLSPTAMALISETHGLSPDGRCRTFDARANGFVRGEGAGMVALKRLSDAKRDGDRIRALIRGWAVNQDGRSAGLTAPNVKSQEALLRRAISRAGLTAEDIGYVETHGTGTPLGDPIETDALRAVLGEPRADGSSCVLGAVKTNLGHLEAAAGVAGLIKAVLALEHEEIPRNLHFRRLNPRISLAGTPLVVPAESVPWKRGPKPRYAGVSGFGISGTNAHVILEEAPAAAAPVSEDAIHLLPLSAKTPAALTALARAYAEQLSGDGAPVAGVAYTASARRAHHDHRLAVAGRTREEIAQALTQAVAAEGHAPPRAGASRAKVVFVFPGQGSQWLGMGRGLLRSEPAFRAAMEACDAAIQRESGFSVLDEIAADEATSRLAEIDVVQPLLFAVEVSLAALWRSWGIEPDVVIGHSMGEVAAAYVAGILSLEDAAKVICRRSRLLRRASGKGAMGLVELTMPDAQKALAGYEDRLSIAVSNAPRSTVISGDPAAMEEVLAALEKRGVFCRRVKVDVASHSPQMDPLLDDLRATLGQLHPGRAALAMRSTVTGEPLAGPECDAAYWVKNLRAPVLFSGVTQQLIDEGHTLFVELSPHPILLPAVEENLRQKDRGGAAIPSSRRGADEKRAMLEGLGALYAHGVDVAWTGLFPHGGHTVSLPAYPWQRDRYWIDAVAPTSGPRAVRGGHPLLGALFLPSDRPEAHYWEQRIGVDALPYLADHQVAGEVVFPGAGYVEMAISAAVEVYGEQRFALENLAFEWMLALPTGSREVQVSLVDEQMERAVVVVSSRDDGSREWAPHAHATVRASISDDGEAWEPVEQIKERCPTVVEREAHYARMDARQIHYGPAFQGVERLWVGAGEALGHVRLPARAGDRSPYRLHPALLDACFQVSAALLAEAEDTFVPIAIGRVDARDRLPDEVWVRASLSPSDSRAETDDLPVVDLVVMDDQGRPLLDLIGMRVRKLAGAAAADPFAGCGFTMAWRPKDLVESSRAEPPSSKRPATWVVFADAGGTGAALAGQLREQGLACVEVVAGARFERRGPTRFTIDPSKPEDYQRVLREASHESRGAPHVVHLWSLDAAAWPSTTAESLVEDVRRGTLSALHVVQAMASLGSRGEPRLVLVTRGAQAAVGDACLIAGAPATLWGLGRTIGMEQADLACSRVDLPPVPRSSEVSLLLRELLFDQGEDQIALRDDGRYVARLERHDVEPVEPPVLDGEATYLITGGLGGLGLSAARWMVARGARHLVLVGRSEPSGEALAAIHAMEEAGAQVVTRRADVSRAADVDSTLAHVQDRMPPLRGIVHAAGVLDDRTLQQMEEKQFWTPVLPKVLGAWNLHAATRDMPLDFFVMYSSAAALFGPPGQGNYAAANAFLDALAHARAAEGLPAASLQWGTFSDVGLAAAQENRGERLMSRGIDTFTPDEGTELLGRLLQRPSPEMGLVRMSVRRWVESYPRAAATPFLAELREQEGRAADAAATSPAHQIRETLQELSPAERRGALERHVVGSIGAVLRLSPDRIDPHSPFVSYGMDSLMSLEIRNRLEPSLGLRLSAALLYTYPTTAKLVDHLLGELNLYSIEDAASVDGLVVPDAATLELDGPLTEEALAVLRELENYGR